jgi:hypothetical protein
MLALLVALPLQIYQASSGPVTRPADSVAIVTQMREETTEFLWVWRFTWQASQAIQHRIEGNVFEPDWIPPTKPLSDRMIRLRVNHLHCHPDGRGGFPVQRTIIREGGVSLRAICPQWAPRDAPAHDERTSLDDAILDPLRSGMRFGRAQLLANLADAAAKLPGDEWIVGQRVRFGVDQRDTAAAMRAVRECRTAPWWCAALGGYVRYTNGDVAGADSLFGGALSAMPAHIRCAMTDVTLLLDESTSRRYANLTCEQRALVDRTLWWLADPLYSELGNERLAEHLARLVMVALRRTSGSLDRWNWSEGDGGTSLREMLVRYGWPAHAWWSGPAEDRSHYGYLGVRAGDDRLHGLFTTAEYSTRRFHTLPAWSAVLDPWAALPTAWTIAAPIKGDGKMDADWWPQEHYARDASALVQLSDHQAALLRRGDGVELAMATDLARVRLDSVSRDADVTFIVTPSPTAMRIERRRTSLDSVAIWRGVIASQPAILGIEARADSGTVGRTRFGVTPPPALSAMRPGEIAISEPVLVRAADAGTSPVSDPDGALRLMLGTTRLVDVPRVGIYWETYGVAGNDSVDVSVRIERLGSPGIFRRLGTALRVADRVDGSATIRWKEPQAVGATTTIDGAVPIQGRNVSIDLSQLVPDRYGVTVSIARNGQVASATREIEIIRSLR